MKCECNVDYKLLLEYIRVFISFPFVLLVILLLFILLFKEELRKLIGKLAKATLPGGTGFELSGGQAERTEKEKDQNISLRVIPSGSEITLPDDLPVNMREYVEAIISSEQSNSRRWEYRYLNLYLVPTTQHVLDWLINYGKPTTITHLDNVMQPSIELNEREAILDALQSHHIIKINNNVVTVTDKGREYVQWRGSVLRQEPSNEEVEK